LKKRIFCGIICRKFIDHERKHRLSNSPLAELISNDTGGSAAAVRIADTERPFRVPVKMGYLGVFWIIYLIASVEELIIAATMKDRFDPFRKSMFQKR
jgi:hypothetical protein